MTPTELADHLSQALRQWRMYAEQEEDRDLGSEDSAEGILYRQSLAALSGAPRAGTMASAEKLAETIRAACLDNGEDISKIVAGFAAKRILALSPKGSEPGAGASTPALLADMLAAFREISKQYENQNLNHVDFRVAAKRTADAMIERAKGSSEPTIAMADTQFAWVIERGNSEPSAPWYWAAGQRDAERSSAWTQNHMAAIRFARKDDAEMVVRRIMKGIEVRVCEHGWDCAQPVVTSGDQPTLTGSWQPIATAPRGGKEIIGWWEAGHTMSIVYHDDEGWVDGDGNLVSDPTHWFPLPAVPALTSGEPCREEN